MDPLIKYLVVENQHGRYLTDLNQERKSYQALWRFPYHGEKYFYYFEMYEFPNLVATLKKIKLKVHKLNIEDCYIILTDIGKKELKEKTGINVNSTKYEGTCECNKII